MLVPLVIAGHYLSGLLPELGRVEVKTVENVSVRTDAATIRKYISKELDREAFDRAVNYQGPPATAAAGLELEKGRDLVLKDDFLGAVPLLRKATESDPASFEAWFWLAESLHRIERIDEAIKAGNAALKAAPSDFRVHAVIASAHFSTDNKKAAQALSRFEEGQRQNPSVLGPDAVSIKALWCAANCYNVMDQSEKAEAAADLFLEKGGSPADRERFRGRVLVRKKQLGEAMSAFEKAMKLDPASPRVHLDIAGVHGDLKEWNAAARAVRRAYTLGHRQPAMFQSLVICYEQLGQDFDARDAAQEGLKVYPENKVLQVHYKVIQKTILARKLKPTGDPTPLLIEM